LATQKMTVPCKGARLWTALGVTRLDKRAEDAEAASYNAAASRAR